MYTKQQVAQLCLDFLGKKPKNIVPYDITDFLDYAKDYNYLNNGVIGSGNAAPVGFPSRNGEVVFFGKLVFSADNANAATAGVNDTLEVYLKSNLIASISTTLHQNQKAVDIVALEQMFFDNFLMYSPVAPGTNSSLYFIGYKIVF